MKKQILYYLQGFLAGILMFALLGITTYALSATFEGPNLLKVSGNTLSPTVSTHRFDVAYLSTGTAAYVLTMSGGVATWAVAAAGGGGLATTSPFSVGYIPYATSSSSLTNSVIYQLSGNVGIGTTSPAYTLDVYGSFRATSASTSALSITGLKSGFLKIDTGGNVSTSTINLSVDTNFVAGIGLTTSTSGQVDLDIEYRTRTVNIAFTNATTTNTRIDMYWNPGVAITITEIGCISDGSMGLDFGEATEVSLSTSSEIAAITCDTDSASTTSFTDAAIAARGRVKGQVSLVTSGTSTWATITYTVND